MRWLLEDFEWKLAQLHAYCSRIDLHETLGPALELATCVAGRLLLEFIGIKAHWKKEPYELISKEPDKRTKDVCCKHFNIELYKLCDLKDGEPEILLNFILRAHRIAHFTRHDDVLDRHVWVCRAVPIIDRIFCEHFYDRVKDRLPAK